VYDTRRNTLGAPPPAHSAAEMERTRRQYAGQIQAVLGGSTRPSTGIAQQPPPPRSQSPRPTSRQSQYADDSYNSRRPGSSMSMHQDLPPRSRSPAPMRPGSRQDMVDYERPRSRMDSMRRSVSPAPYNPHQQRRPSYVDDHHRRSPSPQPYRSTSPAPMPGRPRSSTASAMTNNPFGISMDRYGNVVEPTRSVSPQPPPGYPDRASSRHAQYAYGSQHRHDIDDPPPSVENRYSMGGVPAAHSRARSKSQSDLRARPKYTEDGRQILFVGTCFWGGEANV